MERYKLFRDLPTFKAGDEFFISEKGNLIAGTPKKPKKVLVEDGDFVVPVEVDLMAYSKETLEQFPNILEEWFEEIKEPECSRSLTYLLEWEKAKETLIKDTKGFKPDLGNLEQDRYYVFYNYVGCLDYRLSQSVSDHLFCFKTKEDAKNSIKTHEKEWKIYLKCQD